MNRRVILMLKQIAWNTFKTTGNINTMLELLEVEKTISTIKEKEPVYKKENDELKEEVKWEL